MVRVISVHHFAGQNIQTVEQPTASTVAPPDRLLLALTSNCVEVRDLKQGADVVFSFPTVDEVAQIIHCVQGDYVATVETKSNRQNWDTKFVRVYINWDSIATMQQSKMTSSGVSLGASECGMVQPMRARIAGRVTPTTNQSELGSLEMIEIPVKLNPDMIDCCQISGNLLLLSNKTLHFYSFEVRTHDISKLKFIDFDEIPLQIELPLAPTQIAMCENYISCMNTRTVYMFRVENLSAHHTKETGKLYHANQFENRTKATVDFSELSRLGQSIQFPLVSRANSLILEHNPFIFGFSDMSAAVVGTHQEGRNYWIENLIQLDLLQFAGADSEQLRCMLLEPLYVETKKDRDKSGESNGCKLLKSKYRNSLNSVACIFAARQEAYLYWFDDKIQSYTGTDQCIAVYPFLAPVHGLVMENYFLHALTDTGLESYTLRLGHMLCRNLDVPNDDIRTACPPVTDAICLVGLRPFLSVEQILLSDHHLILLANSDSSPTHSVSSNSSSNTALWTLYSLELPPVATVFEDIGSVAKVHRFTAPKTYCHLMSEANVVLRMASLLSHWGCAEGVTGGVRLVEPKRLEGLEELLWESHVILADHFIMCAIQSDYALALPYYSMAGVPPMDVVKRVKKIHKMSKNKSTTGLMYYLKQTWLSVKYGSEADGFFTTTGKEAPENLLDLFENDAEDLPQVVLKSKFLREYFTDRLIRILTNKCSTTVTTEKTLALAILYIQRCALDKAEDCLRRATHEAVYEFLLGNSELLLDTTRQKSVKVTTFSELTVLLFGVYPELVAELFASLILDERSEVQLNSLIKTFVEYLPSSIGSDSNAGGKVLQLTLEKYFAKYFALYEDYLQVKYERGASEALKLLVRTYLSQLQIFQIKNSSTEAANFEFGDSDDDDDKDKQQEKVVDKRGGKTSEYLLSSQRCEYLDKMPPFQVEITSKLSDNSPESVVENSEADSVLKKLQALLCSGIVPQGALGEVDGFLAVNEDLRGRISLKSLILGVNDAVLFLVEACPQCLVQFGKDRLTSSDEWKLLIASIQKKILLLAQNDERVCFFYKKILKDVLTHVASTRNLEELALVLPQRFTLTNMDELISPVEASTTYSDSDLDVLNEIQNYEPYVTICKEIMHANQMSKLINQTAQQMLTTLSL